LDIQINSEVRSSPADRAIEQAADIFGLLSIPTRLRIVCALMEGESNVSDLVARLAVSQPNLSRHLGVLYRGGLLGRWRDGAQIFYRVNHAQVRGLCGAMSLPAAGPYPLASTRCRATRPT